MTICILAFETGVVYWCLACVSILVLMPPIARAVDEMGVFRKIRKCFFAYGLFIFCFLGLWYLVAPNKTFPSINNNHGSIDEVVKC